MNITNLKTEVIMIYEVAISTSQSLLANEALWPQAQQYLCSASHGNSSPLLKSKMREEVPVSYIKGPCICPFSTPFPDVSMMQTGALKGEAKAEVQ